MKNSFHFFQIISGILILGFLSSSCKKESPANYKTSSVENQTYSDNSNIQPFENGVVPKATVKLLEFDNTNSNNSRDVTSSLTPTLVEAVILPSGSITVNSTATITLPIERGDVMFMFDLTKSMEQELANVKVNTQNIMGAIGAEISDVNFGVVSHMDYTGTYDYCDYYDRYGGAQYGDYPYQLDQSITSDENFIVQAINELQIGWGWDYSEDYTRVLYELSDPDAEIGWRQGAKKIVVAWLDNQPHDCSLGTGPDPGRDEIAETSDDLDISEVLNSLADNNIILFVLYSGGDPLGGDHLEIWENYCAVTGGGAYRINQDGTVPEGVEIEDYIANIIHEEVTHIDQLSLQVCTSGFENWLTNVTPEDYTDINESGSFPFTTEITVPAGTENGIYEFDICLLGDGVEYGRQYVKIRVFDGLAVPFDIRPDGCPNPFNVHFTGKLPVAILGFDGLDVNDIDISSLNIEGVYPSNNSNADVATPYYPFLNKDLDEMSCYNNVGTDGYNDLTLKFDNLNIADLLSDYDDGDIVRIYIEGKLLDGTDILGEDVVKIVKNYGMQINPE